MSDTSNVIATKFAEFTSLSGKAKNYALWSWKLHICIIIVGIILFTLGLMFYSNNKNEIGMNIPVIGDSVVIPLIITGVLVLSGGIFASLFTQYRYANDIQKFINITDNIHKKRHDI